MSFINRPWAFRRRLQYGLGFTSVVLAIVLLLVVVLYEDSANCFDNIVNGTETGVDCGGDCVRICATTVTAPRVLWSDSFEIAKGQYNAVAYVENSNQIAATEALEYTFRLLSNGQTVAERSGVAVLPPDSVYPIFEGRIQTGDRLVTDTEFTVQPVAVWQPATQGSEQFRISDIRLIDADTEPRLRARIENTAITEATDVEVVTTLFSAGDIPVTASQTFVENLAGRTSTELVFTWPESITKTVRSCSVPSDVVLGIDVSGSMNNDSTNPPEPITSALTAANNFVDRLGDDDQAAVVSFATDALVAVSLTDNKNEVSRVIEGLSITEAAETGFTNTIAALQNIENELSSVRHNNDARRAAVLLTDGLPTGQEESEVLIEQAVSMARAMQEDGVTLYTIGLGQNVDQEFIRSLVENPAQAYFASSGEDLDEIYQQITGALCEVGTTRIDIIPKTTTNFIPLQ